jgi:predicted transcriptional regulator
MPKAEAPVAVKVTTLRLAQPLHRKLELLQQVLGKPLNKLVNEAIDDYVERRTAEVEIDLQETLQRIKAARKKDPTFKRAIAEFVAAEARYAKSDPVEGTLVHTAEPGPAQSLVRSMLSRS